MEEVWKGLVYNNIDYSERLEISNLGNLRNSTNKHVYKLQLNPNGYYETYISLGHKGYGKTFKIHRCVACTFLPNPENKPTVNHIDGNKQNNCLTNLEWATDSENIQHAYDTGLNYASNKKISNTAMDEVLIRFFKGENLTTIVKDYSFSLPTLSTYLEKYVIDIGLIEQFNLEKVRQKNLRAKNSVTSRVTFNVIGISLLDPSDIITFSSLSDAARALGKTSSGPISNCLSGRAKSAYGYVWTRS